MDSDQLLPAVDSSLTCQGIWNRRLRGSLPPSGPILSALSVQIFQRTADVINWDSDWFLPGHGSKWIWGMGVGKEG
ncbi:hypothetical protein H9L39_18793 [Fusarium oxysporum f. sp. albedinis]|jgi:hypothetical protein|nr:hypothetical protein H9L39_18793 [Fusarium oxysporum f. sp. albedinis]